MRTLCPHSNIAITAFLERLWTDSSPLLKLNSRVRGLNSRELGGSRRIAFVITAGYAPPIQTIQTLNWRAAEYTSPNFDQLAV